jgi:hypothetical protein
MPRPLILIVVLILPACFGLDLFNPLEDTGNGPGPYSSDTSGPNNSNGEKPTVDNFTVSETETKVRMDFIISDPDKNMAGGSVEIEIDGNTTSYTFPDDLFTSNGNTFLLFEKSIFTANQQTQCELTAIDLTGLRSSPASSLFTLSSNSLEVPENGDTAADITSLGPLNPPVAITGNIWGAGNLGGLYNADLDFISFTLPTTKTYTFTLTWTPASADYDLHLIEGNGTTLAYSTSYGQPEVITYSLSANALYYIAVGAWEGSSGTWTLNIQ